MVNSTGSSMVLIFIPSLSIEFNNAYRVVDFPLPVGPFITTIPCFNFKSLFILFF